MKKFAIYYSFILLALITFAGFFNARNPLELAMAILFFPVLVYFTLLIWPKKKSAFHPENSDYGYNHELSSYVFVPEVFIEEEDIILSEIVEGSKPKGKKKKEEKEDIAVKAKRLGFDHNRRNFIKLIGTGGLTLFLFSLFTKDAEAAFFGSVPGPGTVRLKDIAGNQIDPAEKQPTDGYRIVQIDDSVPAYYGFTNKDAEWYIMREDASGNYRYKKGTVDFTTNWSARAGLTYQYFDQEF